MKPESKKSVSLFRHLSKYQMKRPILLAMFFLFSVGAGLQAQLIEAGSWYGKLQFPGQSLRLVIHLEETETGWDGSLDSPDQNITGIEADEISVNGNDLSFRIDRLQASYHGTAEEDEEGNISIVGTFSQAGFEIPLTLGKEELEGPKRPQTPKGPYSYTVKDVAFESPETGITLMGTLTIPKTGGPFPGVVLISGSGPQDRDETIAGHRPFHVIADVLSRQGIAVLRYDERGIGESEGEFSTATSYDFSLDAEAALNYLISREETIEEKCGFAGHSEGGLIAPMIAARKEETGFIILLAGPSIPGREVLDSQSDEMLGKAGIAQSTRDEFIGIRQSVYQILQSTPSDSMFKEKISAQADSLLSPLSGSEKLMLGLNEETLADQFGILATPWFRYFLEYDPYPALEQVSCPILALNGDLDVQVLPDPNLTRIESLLEEGGHPASRAVLLEGLNHLFQPAETGMPVEYASIETTFDPETLDLMASWILSLE